jgi:hypothetical protein
LRLRPRIIVRRSAKAVPSIRVIFVRLHLHTLPKCPGNESGKRTEGEWRQKPVRHIRPSLQIHPAQSYLDHIALDRIACSWAIPVGDDRPCLCASEGRPYATTWRSSAHQQLSIPGRPSTTRCAQSSISRTGSIRFYPSSPSSKKIPLRIFPKSVP